VIGMGRTSPFSLVAARDGDVYSVDEWGGWPFTVFGMLYRLA
jgi:hypothetical protein